MTDVFISYSRRDNADGFVTRLFDSLEAEQIDAWLDKQDIPPAFDFLKEIYPAIETADNFLYIISPDSVSSEYCQKELEHAIKLNKRLFPVVRRDTKADTVHPLLRPLNWIFFIDDNGYDAAFNLLLQAIKTADQNYVHTHTRLLTRALQWESNQRNTSFLLRGTDLQTAEAWFGQSGGKEPKPTELQTDYIFVSRKVANRQQRNLLAGVSAALVITAVLAIVALLLRSQSEERRVLADNNAATATVAQGQAQNNEATAVRVAQEAQSLAWAAQAERLYAAGDTSSTYLALAVEANRYPDPPALAQQALENQTYPFEQRRHFTGHDPAGSVFSVAFSPGERTILSGASRGEVILWDVATGQEIRRFVGHDSAGSAFSVAFSPDGKTVLSGASSGEVILWNVATGQEIRQFITDDASVNSVAFSPDGLTVLSGATGGELILWDAATGQEIRRFNTGNASVNSVAFSPDGQTIVSGALGGELILWDAATGQEIRRFIGHNSNQSVSRATFSPDGLTVLSGATGGELILWDVATGQEIHHLSGHDPNWTVLSVAFSRDGKTLLSGTGFGELILWDATDGHEVRHVTGRSTGLFDSLRSLAFSPDGRTVVSGTDFGELILWQIETVDQLVQWTLANLAVPALGCDQRELYNVTPLCVDGTPPVLTPYLTWTPSPTAMATPTATATPSGN